MNQSSQPAGHQASFEFIALMAVMTSIIAFSIDAMLPALPQIAADLGVADVNDRQLVVIVLFVGLALAQIAYGPISDTMGRKPAAYIGFTIFIIGSFLCIFAGTFEIMLIGRFLVIVPMLALAGSLGAKARVPPSLGTFPVTTPLFTTLLVGVIVIVGVLTFFPVLSLGPIVEHFLMDAGTTF